MYAGNWSCIASIAITLLKVVCIHHPHHSCIWLDSFWVKLLTWVQVVGQQYNLLLEFLVAIPHYRQVMALQGCLFARANFNGSNLAYDCQAFGLELSSLPGDLAVLYDIGIIINAMYKITIWINCTITIPVKYAHSHTISHHCFKPPPPLESDMTCILKSFGCVDDFTAPSGIVPPIVSLKVLDSLVFLIEGCSYLSAFLWTMQEHFKIIHSNDQWRPNTKKQDIQCVYEFHGNQTLILVDLNQIMPL
ncbi:uncharacterized protein F5891DRAFT_976530 [Suillus fuscotomentosus]|uniref:Uncharacterized protein n=1 Tax=Suillus fuscotomentosus TaxID=1912939 RepID=A0AAD4HQD4_9AGAM|nr:uncharacterized protein F5891DRAFT_976530 [Suillus fuscotomentosus]KAG1904947.1 hypothetical protein F5891DRAFT_976530 [Suillus fuscotomentosus]